jgi:hypothetical protein
MKEALVLVALVFALAVGAAAEMTVQSHHAVACITAGC